MKATTTPVSLSATCPETLPFQMLADPESAAKAARLRYVSDTLPGIRRLKARNGFRYLGPDDKSVRDEKTLERIAALGIPPAYTDVWICPIPNGHLQATGRDAKGRKQYRYHARWRTIRDETKYDRMLAFCDALPHLRERVQNDLSRPGMPREKVLATVARLLEMTHIRIGNEEYARANQSYGLTTLKNDHVDINGTQVQFRFRGKSGKDHEIALRDSRIARVLRKCQELPGQELFEYVDSEDGTVRRITSEDVNDYLRETMGDSFTAKDFRTWAGTRECARLLLAACADATEDSDKKQCIKEAIEQTAALLGNTPTICRKCYVHPAILTAFEDGSLAERIAAPENTVFRILGDV